MKQSTCLCCSKAAASFLRQPGKSSASFSVLWENYTHQRSGLPSTGRGMVSVDSVTIIQFYRESFIDSLTSSRVEERVCVCVCVSKVQCRDSATIAKAHGCCLSLSPTNPSCSSTTLWWNDPVLLISVIPVASGSYLTSLYLTFPFWKNEHKITCISWVVLKIERYVHRSFLKQCTMHRKHKIIVSNDNNGNNNDYYYLTSLKLSSYTSKAYFPGRCGD